MEETATENQVQFTLRNDTDAKPEYQVPSFPRGIWDLREGLKVTLTPSQMFSIYFNSKQEGYSLHLECWRNNLEINLSDLINLAQTQGGKMLQGRIMSEDGTMPERVDVYARIWDMKPIDLVDHAPSPGSQVESAQRGLTLQTVPRVLGDIDLCKRVVQFF